MSGEIVVCLKWASHPNEPGDDRFASMSAADQAALELALQWAELIGGAVTAITVGPPPAERVLREALACGAKSGVRVDSPPATESADVASAIAAIVPTASWLWCGDYSTDNGSGSVPGFLAAALNAQQALGVVTVSFNVSPSEPVHVIVARRRVDGGRREVLDVRSPAIISVEGNTAQLRRASLAATRSAATAHVDVVTPTTPMRTTHHSVVPYRPRARALAVPSGVDALERVRNLTAATVPAAVHEVEELAPPAAATRIMRALREWGYV